MPEASLAKLEQQLKDLLASSTDEAKFELLLRPMKLLEVKGNQVVLGTESEMLRDWMCDEFAGQIRTVMERLLETDEVELNYEVVASESPEVASTPEIIDYPESASEEPADNESGEPRDRTESPNLNPRFTFENFVVDDSNEFAFTAAQAAAGEPGKVYNPLFIYSNVGLGKTHLLHSIGHRAIEEHSPVDVVYVPTESFVKEYVDRLEEKNIPEFNEKYRNCDILLIDDIQFLTGKERTQEEFFHTFNALVENNSQIVITSDQPPLELDGLDERLMSRFNGGLIGDIDEPGLEMRIAVLRKRADLEGVELPREVAEYIAENVTENIRRLEGALTKLLALAQYSGREINMDLASRALKDLMPDTTRGPTSVETIKNAVCDLLKIDPEVLVSRNKTKDVAFARMVAMFLTREFTNLSLERIGEEFGGRDHSTVVHACQKISRRMAEEERVASTVNKLRSTLG